MIMQCQVRLVLAAVLLLYGFVSVLAIPAQRGSAVMRQPDGSSVTLCLHGDEYLHYTTTEDGYSVVKDHDGFYVYAELQEGSLVGTGRIAHDQQSRSEEEQAWLQGVKKYQKPAMSRRRMAEREAEMSRRAAKLQAAVKGAPRYNYKDFRGLVILIEYNDCKFSIPDSKQVFSDMFCKENYTGYDDTPLGQFTGSVRDYFYDNSNGVFSPQFDFVGPIAIDYSQYYVNGTDNCLQLVKAAAEAVDSLIDYSLYDGDHDGVVDLVYLIFAGLGSHCIGNDPRLLWPHELEFYDPTDYSPVKLDGIQLGFYACSTELGGIESYNFLTGVGTVCHEVSHVLGLQDFYDMDYEEHGQSADPDGWSIMASGANLNNGRTPAGYTLYERYALGFATPELIDKPGDYTLHPIGDTNMGYRLNSPEEKEYFLLENRQQTSKWDQSLPGHGMLVFRVDSTYAPFWTLNVVNAYAERNCFVLVRAGGADDYPSAKPSDPFPGTMGVHRLTNTTSPANLLTRRFKPNDFCLLDINEGMFGDVSFRVVTAQEASFTPGDANGDGVVNAADIVEVVNYIMGSPSAVFDESAADMNGDGVINAADIVFIVNCIMSAN